MRLASTIYKWCIQFEYVYSFTFSMTFSSQFSQATLTSSINTILGLMSPVLLGISLQSVTLVKRFCMFLTNLVIVALRMSAETDVVENCFQIFSLIELNRSVNSDDKFSCRESKSIKKWNPVLLYYIKKTCNILCKEF